MGLLEGLCTNGSSPFSKGVSTKPKIFLKKAFMTVRAYQIFTRCSYAVDTWQRQADVKGVVPGIKIPDHAIGPGFAVGMRVCRNPHFQVLIPVQAAPDLGPPHKEALVSGQAIYNRRFLTVKRHAVCLVSNGKSGQVADVFTKCELSVEKLAGQYFKLVVLADKVSGAS